MNDDAIIELQRVSKQMGGQAVLDGLDLRVPRGETLVIMGRSGAGKSVILKHIIGLLRPDSGRVLFDGRPLGEMSRRQLNEVRMHIGMLFQSAALFDSMNVGRNVSVALRQHTRLAPAKIEAIVREKLEAVGLSGVEGKMPAELSGGMRKRVGLARAIAMDPEVILYDEPTTGIDPITADQINDLIVDTRRRLGVTSVVVTHDVQSALRVGTRFCFLLKGRIYFSGGTGELENSKDPVLRQFLEGRAEGPLTLEL
jgi:phospholipid/cholesterol/gamma-HCH transport system ATP-binding protein